MMEKVKRKGKLTINKIPGATQERLWNKKHIIFTREDSDLSWTTSLFLTVYFF